VTGGPVTGQTEKTVVRMEIITNPTSHSQEGKRPNLAGLSVRVWYNDGGAEVLGPSAFATDPAIIGEAQLASNVNPGLLTALVTDPNSKATGSTPPIKANEANTVAVSTPIVIRHRSLSGVTAVATIPGVQALQEDIVNPEAGWAPRASANSPTTLNYHGRMSAFQAVGNFKRVVGNDGTGVKYEGGLTGGVTIYEDGSLDSVLEALKGVRVEVKYQRLFGGNAASRVRAFDYAEAIRSGGGGQTAPAVTVHQADGIVYPSQLVAWLNTNNSDYGYYSTSETGGTFGTIPSYRETETDFYKITDDYFKTGDVSQPGVTRWNHKILLDGVGASVDWEWLELTADHLLVDFTENFLGEWSNATDSRRALTFGVDPNEATGDGRTGVVNVLLSRGIQHGGRFNGVGSRPVAYPFFLPDVYPLYDNTSIYIRIPLSSFAWIRKVENVSVDWSKAFTGASRSIFGLSGNPYVTSARPAATPYVLQPQALRNNTNAWVSALYDGDVEFEVLYSDGTTATRNKYDFYRGWLRARAGVYNWPVNNVGALTSGPTEYTYAQGTAMDPEDDGYGELVVGYYTSADNMLWYRSAIDKGQFANFGVVPLPIATYVEDSGQLLPQAALPQAVKDSLPLKFVSQVQQPAANTMPADQLEAIRNTYEFSAEFEYEGTTERVVLVTGPDIQARMFTVPNALWERLEPNLEAELEFRIPQNEYVTGSPNTHPDAYLNGQEGGSVLFEVYPPGYDVH